MVDIKSKKEARDDEGYYYKFTITTDDGEFDIHFARNLDLYWSYFANQRLKPGDKKIITITKENYFLYSLFEELYEDVENYNMFNLDESDFLMCETMLEAQDMIKENEEQRKFWHEIEKQKPERLFRNNAIEWHCDDYSYQEGNILKIKRKKETFKVIFEQGTRNKELSSRICSVRMRNSRSGHDPFNQLFMRMYRKLIGYTPTNQMHIEEYLYAQRKRTSRK